MNHTIRTEKLSRIAILATAFFVFWIYLGSIINFHQHHIFGRTLMPQGILAKREDSLQIDNQLPVYIVFSSISCDQEEHLIPEPAWKEIKTANVIHNLLSPKAESPLFHGLRAPPVA